MRTVSALAGLCFFAGLSACGFGLHSCWRVCASFSVLLSSLRGDVHSASGTSITSSGTGPTCVMSDGSLIRTYSCLFSFPSARCASHACCSGYDFALFWVAGMISFPRVNSTLTGIISPGLPTAFTSSGSMPAYGPASWFCTMWIASALSVFSLVPAMGRTSLGFISTCPGSTSVPLRCSSGAVSVSAGFISLSPSLCFLHSACSLAPAAILNSYSSADFLLISAAPSSETLLTLLLSQLWCTGSVFLC